MHESMLEFHALVLLYRLHEKLCPELNTVYVDDRSTRAYLYLFKNIREFYKNLGIYIPVLAIEWSHSESSHQIWRNPQNFLF